MKNKILDLIKSAVLLILIFLIGVIGFRVSFSLGTPHEKEEYVNQHINLADTSVLCKELSRRKDIGDDFFVVATEGK